MKTSNGLNDIYKAAHSLSKQQIAWRRHLHQYPELSNEETQTTAFLKDHLKKLGLKFLPLKTKTGVLAELKGNAAGPVVAIRSDIDALPILENSGLPFQSKNAGCMHACGHDIHMATVLGTATVLAQLKNTFAGTVRFIFQPAEELPPGGARPMIASGAVADAKMIFGLHVDPEVPTGRIGLRDGATMASVFDFTLRIFGVSGHAARPHSAVDAIVTAAEVIGSLQTIVSREIDPIEPVVITFGKIEGGTASNVIANEVVLAGTARTLSAPTFRKLPKLIARTVNGICKARGASFAIEPIADYPVLSNSPAANNILRKNFDLLFGAGKVMATPPVLGGEDFACYLQEVPGAMFRLGVMNKRIKADKPWHSPQFIADEAALPFGTALLAAAARDVLKGN
jgi:amidohydrolase